MPASEVDVEAPLARDDERRAGERLAEPDDLRDELRPGDETGSERSKATGEPARRAGPGQLADVDAVVRAVALGELRQPALELRDRVRICSLLRAEDRGSVDERRRHVARDDDLRSPEVEVERLERPEPAVHGRRPADRDEDVLDALVESCADQLAGPHGRRGERVVRAGDEGEAARARHLDDRGVAAHAPLGVDRRSEGPGDTGRPAVGRLRAEDVQRALAAVRERQPERRAADPLDPVRECSSGRARAQTAAELVRAAEDRPVGRHAARISSAARSVAMTFCKFVCPRSNAGITGASKERPRPRCGSRLGPSEVRAGSPRGGRPGGRSPRGGGPGAPGARCPRGRCR